MTLTFYILDEGNHRSGPYASLAEAAQQLCTHWDHVHADEDGKFRPLTPAEQEALAKLRSLSGDAQQGRRINADRERAKRLQQDCTHLALDWRGHCIRCEMHCDDF